MKYFILFLIFIITINSWAMDNQANSIEPAQIGKLLAEIGECEKASFRDCESYIKLDDILKSQEGKVYLSQLQQIVIKSSMPKITMASLDLILTHLSRDEAIPMIHDIISTAKDNANKINSFFIITLIVLAGLTTYFIYMNLQFRKLKREMQIHSIKENKEN